MTRFVATIGLSLVFLAVFQSFAEARECGKRDKVVKFLASKYKEVLVAGGMVSSQGYMEVYASKGGETWTILYTNVRGVSCVMSSGQGYFTMEPKPVKDPRA